MKKTALIAMAFIWTIVAQGQNTDTTGYQSFFGQESTEWWGMIGYPDYYEYRVIRTTYDTMIDGVQYKKAENNIIFNYEEYAEHLDFPIFLREDTGNGRLWCRAFDEGEGMSEEVLIVDMSLSLEDTIILGGFFLPWDRNAFVVQSLIDTGSTRPLVLRDGYGTEIRFIEMVKNNLSTQGRIDVSNLPKGMCFLQICTGTSNVCKTILKS